MYTKVEEAIHFMVKANKGQKRKNENIDKSFHSMIIYSMLRDFTTTEDVLVSALLHDSAVVHQPESPVILLNKGIESGCLLSWSLIPCLNPVIWTICF